jgi:6-phosphogluconate dehydrogenase
MELGIIGLGRMGANMARRLLKEKHKVVVYNRTPDKTRELGNEGAIPSFTLDELMKQLPLPKIVWLMVPAGKPVDDMIGQLLPMLTKGDILIDGGNSRFIDTIRRNEFLSSKGIKFLDVGTSGGIWGLKEGYCLMIGGEEASFKKCEPIFKSLAPSEGYGYMGPSGSGHYVKMVHNGIEYGMLQAYGEGFEILNASNYKLDLFKIAKLWNRGSVVRSWLLELAEDALAKDSDLSEIKGYVEDSGEGRWTVQEAIDHNVPAPVITLSLLERMRSRQTDSFSAKMIAALRNEFGGHAVLTAKS